MAFTGEQIVQMEWRSREWERIERERIREEKERRLPYHQVDNDLAEQVRDRGIYLKVDEIPDALGERRAFLEDRSRFVPLLDYGWEPSWFGNMRVFERDRLKITKLWKVTSVSYNGDNVYTHSFSRNAERWLMRERGTLPRIHIYKPGQWEEILNSAYQEIPKTHGGQ